MNKIWLASVMSEAEELEHSIVEPPNLATVAMHYLGDDFWSRMIYNWQDLFFSILAIFILAAIFYFGARRKLLIPSRLQNALEMLVDGIYSFLYSILGEEGKRYIPFLGSLFFYLLAMNLFGLIPLLKPPSGSLNVTAAQAICVFLFVQYLSVKQMGLWGYFHHLAGSPKGVIGWLMAPLLFPIELLTQIARPFTLAFRLFGNIFGEEIVVGYFALLGISMVPIIHPFGIPLQIPFLFLGLLTATLQALVFTLLATIYILLSIPNHDEHEAH